MLTIVKLALRITTEAFDTELNLLISDCLSELAMLGINAEPTTVGETPVYDPQIQTTVIAYCKWKFGNNESKDDWQRIYHEKLGQLKVASGYQLEVD